MLSPRTCVAGPTRQPAESESRAFSSGHSTALEPMSIDTGSLRRRVMSPYVDREGMDVNLQKLEEIINMSAWLRDGELEPCIGERNCPAEADPYGIRGLSVYTAFVKNQHGDAYGCKYERCRAYSTRSMEEAVRHQRHHHFNHSPYLCVPANGGMWYVSVFSHTRALIGN